MNDYYNQFDSRSEKSLAGAKILFLVGSLGISGGTNLILNYAKCLADSGAEVYLSNLIGVKNDAQWHPAFHDIHVLESSEAQSILFDLVIATWWPTVYELHKYKTVRYLYFVQSLEHRFAWNSIDLKSEYMAARSYLFNLPIITVADWLQNFLICNSQSPVWFIRNGIDKKLFPLREPRPKLGKLRVLVEGPLGIPMKAVDETLNYLSAIENISITHISPTKGTISAKVDQSQHGINLKDMHSIYENTDLIVKMSRVEGMFGPPLEAFHSGATAVVSKVTGYFEYIRNNRNSLVVDVDDFESMVDKVELLGSDSDLLLNLKYGAYETAKFWPDVTETGTQFANLCYQLLSSKEINFNVNEIRDFLENPTKIYTQSDVRENLPTTFYLN